MNFLVDAQLPKRLSDFFRDQGHDSLHTLELPSVNRTPDAELNRLSLAQARVVVTKDSDFVDSFLLHHEPWKLLLVATGNIRNDHLMQVFRETRAASMTRRRGLRSSV